MRPATLLARLTRSCMLEVLSQDYVRTARAKGWPKGGGGASRLRNALIPVITVLGTQVSDLLSGAVLTETIFALAWHRPPRWKALSTGLPHHGGIIFMALIFLVANLIVDLSYGFIDPRVRYD